MCVPLIVVTVSFSLTIWVFLYFRSKGLLAKVFIIKKTIREDLNEY